MKTPTNPPPLAALSWNAVRRGLRLAERDVKPPQGGGALALALCLLASTPAGAQSERALDSVRFGRVDAADRVAAELSACAQEECPRLRHLSLLSGYLELSRGNTVLAVKTLGARPPPPSLEPVHAYYLGLSLFYAREPRKAVKSLEQALKGAPPWLEPRIRAKLGEAWFEAGEAAPACAELEKVTNQIGAPELFYRRALCRAALNNGTGARSDWEYLAVNHPTHPYAESALAELARLPSPWKPSLDARSRRARAFSDAGGGAACLKELDAAQSEGLVRGDTAQGRWFLQRAGCLYAMGRASEADEAVERARKQGPTLVAAEAGLLQARRTLRTHDNDSARKQMADLVRAYPDEWPAREAAFLVGWLDLQLGKYEDALKSFDAYEKRYRGSGRRDDVLWLGAWARIRLGRYAEAAEKLQDLEKSFPRSEFTAQVRYWYARCVQYVKSPAEAASLYGKVVEQHPSTLYATFARERLRETGQPVPPPFGGVAPADPPPQPNDGLDLGRALASVGLYRDAAAELQKRASAVRGSDAALRLGHAFKRMEEFGLAHAVAARALWGPAYFAHQPEALALLYPKAFEPFVRSAATSQGVDPFWMWSLMRRESAFRPNVTSGADARGLMQFIPKTAKAVAAALSLPPPEPSDLYRPELNVKLAAWYLAALHRRFGHPALVAAAYNAGPPAVLRWLGERGDVPLDAFVEEIPYKETRAYVKQVLADYHLYHALYGDLKARPRLDFVLPKPTLDGVSF